MLSTDKLTLFVNDVCTITGELPSPTVHRQILDLSRILTATGCGSWPFNTEDQNFIEYMSALSVAVSHLFRMPIDKRDVFVNNGLRNVNLMPTSNVEQTSSWISTELDSIELSNVEEFIGHVVYRPDVASNTGDTKSIQCEPSAERPNETELAVSCGTINWKPILETYKLIDPSETRFLMAVHNQHGADMEYNSDVVAELGLPEYVRPFPDFQGSEPPSNCPLDEPRSSVRLQNASYIIKQLDTLLFSTSVKSVPDAYYHATVPYLMSALPAKQAALFLRIDQQKFCRKFSPRVKESLAFLQNLATHTMCPY